MGQWEVGGRWLGQRRRFGLLRLAEKGAVEGVRIVVGRMSCSGETQSTDYRLFAAPSGFQRCFLDSIPLAK